jgi:O-antigen/teichoic acid export membrane protein
MASKVNSHPEKQTRGAGIMLFSAVAIQVLALLRNVAVARIIGPENFGLAATIILFIAFLDAISNSGFQNLMVQSKDDREFALLKSAHAISITRGVISCVLLAICAVPLSRVVGGGMTPAAILVVAAASLIGGFAHRGVRYVQRQGDFTQDAVCQFLGELAFSVAAIAVALITQSYFAVVVGLIARSAALVISSHAISKLKYEVKPDRATVKRYWDYSWPLLINGPLVFLSTQADRVFVSVELGIASLGVYSAILLLVASPTAAIMKWLGAYYLPRLSKQYHSNHSLKDNGSSYEFGMCVLVIGWGALVGFSSVGLIAVNILYGDKYSVESSIIVLIGLLQAARFVRMWPSTLALAAAASGGILVATIIRLASLPLGFAGVVFIGGLEGLLIGFIIGEIIALSISLYIVNRRASRSWDAGMLSVLTFALLAIAIALIDPAGRTVLFQAMFLSVALPVGGAALAVALSASEFSASLRRAIASLRR